MFFGVGEPLLHFASPPPFGDIEPGSDEAARTALEFSFFHWTLHPWAIYGIAGLGLAYATFRKRAATGSAPSSSRSSANG